MSKNLADIEQFTLYIPKLWEKDWAGAIDMAAGAQKEILVYQARAANLLKNITDRQATFEKLAWLTMWTKAFTIADSLHGTLDRNSQYILEIISRVSFEQMLHIHTIIQPFHAYHDNTNIPVPAAKKKAWTEVMGRMQAYTAWCLWNDKLHHEELLDFRTLRGIWDSQPAGKIARSQDERAKYEAIFGELDIEADDRVLKKGRLEQQDRGQHNLHRLNTWLTHPQLTPWVKKIERLSGRRTGKQPVSFFSLFNESEESVCRRLSSMGIRFMYISYIQGSLFIHGSTMDQILMFRDGLFTPQFPGNSEEVESSASYVASLCNNIIVLLSVLQSHLWPSDKTDKLV